MINLHSSPVKINKDEGLPSKNEDMNQFELQVISEKRGGYMENSSSSAT